MFRVFVYKLPTCELLHVIAMTAESVELLPAVQVVLRPPTRQFCETLGVSVDWSVEEDSID